MSQSWQEEFRHRMDRFNTAASPKEGLPVSVKIRVTGGCFHREHSPQAYKIIDKYLASSAPKEVPFSFQEHESGPELLVYLALGTAGITLAKSIIDLITTIVKARSEGIKKGDKPDAPIEIIVRGFHEEGKFYEETVLRFDPKDPASRSLIEKALQDSTGKMVKKPKAGRRGKTT